MSVQYRKGRVNLDAQWLWAGEDVLVLITGGDRPHIGAICLNGPQERLQTISCTGHREDELSGQMARYLSARLGRKVAVVAGMHWDEFSPQLLAEIENAWQEMAERLYEQLKNLA